MAVSKRRLWGADSGCSCSMPGVWRAVAHNPGAVVVYHAPRACTHITGRMDRYDYYCESRFDQPAGQEWHEVPLISTRLEDKHVIFGGGNLLRECLDYVVVHYQPAYVVVANSCLSGVIGDDSEGICREKEAESGIPIINIDQHGFLDGEYYGGYCTTALALAERFVQPVAERRPVVCVLGEKGGPYSRNAVAIRELIEGFGIAIGQRFPSYSSLADLRAVASCSWLWPLGGSRVAFDWMEKLARQMSQRLHIPYFTEDYPVGIEPTLAWLHRFGAFLGKPETVPEVCRRQKEKMETARNIYGPVLRQKNVTLAFAKRATARSPIWVIECLQYMGMKINGIVFLYEEDEAQCRRYCQEWGIPEMIPVYPESRGMTLLEDADLVLSMKELEGEQLRQLFLPMVPPIGITGLIRFCQKLYRLACHQRGRGVILNGW